MRDKGLAAGPPSLIRRYSISTINIEWSEMRASRSSWESRQPFTRVKRPGVANA